MKGRRRAARLIMVAAMAAGWLGAGAAWPRPAVPGHHGPEVPAAAVRGAPVRGAPVRGAAVAGPAVRGARAAVAQTRACAVGVCRRGMPAGRDLRATQQPQLTGYFCGPATVSEMLAQMGKRVSQRQAAAELGTTTSGTGWSDLDSDPVPAVLNENQRRNDYQAVGLPWAPTRPQLRAYERDLVTDINYRGGVPLAGDAYEVPGGPHLVGHPLNQTIYHWFDIRGYQEYGSLTDYEDSVHNASSIGWAATVPGYSSLPSATIVTIVGARGYDW